MQLASPPVGHGAQPEADDEPQDQRPRHHAVSHVPVPGVDAGAIEALPLGDGVVETELSGSERVRVKVTRL